MTTKPPKRRAAAVDPFDYAMVTGGPLPATFPKFRAIWRVEHPYDHGLLGIPGFGPLADVFQQVHGRKMTKADAAAIVARWPEVRAHTNAQVAHPVATTPPPAKTSNWTDEQAADFTPVVRIEGDD
jgi:hypothetical protein